MKHKARPERGPAGAMKTVTPAAGGVKVRSPCKIADGLQRVVAMLVDRFQPDLRRTGRRGRVTPAFVPRKQMRNRH